ncbi:hypothetical protein P1J78_09305 [Psychromarinibacter sp. C21-152]|uniref:Uncharacterized protein n=1 Tax=Psychromarinibacter sediminicola TaxID=3033385 RepID=A0AAE3NRU8_9RHOB|nr:hypothetical protein [Psychromarinibacter sediminicola]MDF0600927.1 hypothetical protein [Psychromarinibacter sediminicola]
MMEIHGIDLLADAYRVSLPDGDRTIRGLVPESLVQEWSAEAGRPVHEDVYKWIARHRPQIEKALKALSRGDTKIRAPYDRLSLVEE